MKTKYTTYPDCPDGFWQEVKREIVKIDLSELEQFIDKAKIEL